MENTAISWTDHTINLWWGCSKVSPGCKNCYADTFSRRWGKDIWGPGKPREDHRKNAIKTALKLEREAQATINRIKADIGNASEYNDIAYDRPRIFCSSMSDWLDDEVPIEWLADLLELIWNTPNLDWLLLSKRPENWETRMRKAYASRPSTASMQWVAAWIHDTIKPFPASAHPFPRIPQNVWIGTTVEDQQRADERIPQLLKIPAKVRFLSCEPLLEPLHLLLGPNLPPGSPLLAWLWGIDWLICGGESGPGFRPFNPDWARTLRDQCKAAHVPFHMKQMGGLKPSTMPPIPDDLMIRELPTT